MIVMNNSITEPFLRDAKCQASEETDLENGTQVVESNSDFEMEAFNKQIQEIEIQVDKLSGRLVNLKNLLRDANKESKSVTKASEMIVIKKRMEKYINDVGNIARNVNGKLQVITVDILLLRQMPGRQMGTASDRARMNMTNVLTKKLKELMIEFEALREIVQDEYREVVERRVITVTGSSPDELVIDHLIETGISEQTFPNAFEQTRQGKVVSTMDEIQERLDAVKELEKRLSELHQIYLKTAALVEGQAKPLDNIENQGRNAQDRSQSRIKAIQAVKNLEKESRKGVMYIIITVLVVIILNLLPADQP
ncbi:syntaxin-132-like isoform X2 [Cucurbita pepo subsp. pepo]|uniref:syntaxin-132-like isoform X2 n=1 Tax=Cucurbita pepo subsp. pepo TaxID=3664 RepID=UPI000C9D7345|nr:syntaxin-132-like isoform X2 [Cucurbita pepo subsp. pepo]